MNTGLLLIRGHFGDYKCVLKIIALHWLVERGKRAVLYSFGCSGVLAYTFTVHTVCVVYTMGIQTGGRLSL